MLGANRMLGRCAMSTTLFTVLCWALQVLEIDRNAVGETCMRLLTPAAPAGAVSAWAHDESAQLRPCGLC